MEDVCVTRDQFLQIVNQNGISTNTQSAETQNTQPSPDASAGEAETTVEQQTEEEPTPEPEPTAEPEPVPESEPQAEETSESN